MNELMKMVQERQDQIARRMAAREAEIEDLRAEAKKLENFVTLAKELFEKREAQGEAAPAQKAAPKEAPRVLPARQPAQGQQPPSHA